MDSATLNISYALELCMAIPAFMMALAPVNRSLSIGKKEAYGLAAAYLALLIGAGAIVCRRLYLPTVVFLVPGSFLLFLPYAQAVDLSLPKKVFCFANAMMLCSFSNMYATVIMAAWEAHNPAKVHLPQTGFLALVIAAVLCLLFYKTLVEKLPALLYHDELDDLWRWLVLIPVALAALMWWMIPRDPALVLLGRTGGIMLVVTALIPIAAWVLYHIAWNVMSRVWEEAKLRQEVTILRAEEKRLAELRTYMDEGRALRHDFRHHLLAMRGMLESNKIDDLSEYIEQLTSREAESQRPRLCKNMAVDSLAAYYDAIAREKRVVIGWLLDLPEQLPVAEVDYCSVLGNLVENAILATAELEESKRWVEVVSQEVTDHALGINVRNTFAGEVEFDRDGLPKAHKRSHGVGLPSVVATVQRYNGGLDVQTQDGEFFAGAIMYHD